MNDKVCWNIIVYKVTIIIKNDDILQYAELARGLKIPQNHQHILQALGTAYRKQKSEWDQKELRMMED